MAAQTRILIVEDEEILAENMRDYLRRRIAEVRHVASGEAALDCLRGFAPDRVVLDYGLPGMDGVQTYSALKAQTPDLDAVLITGHPTDELLHAAAAVGIRHVLSKPFSFSELAAILLPEPVCPQSSRDADECSAAESRRNGDRRHLNGNTSLPLRTADGWITCEQRRGERRMTSDRRLAASGSISDPV